MRSEIDEPEIPSAVAVIGLTTPQRVHDDVLRRAWHLASVRGRGGRGEVRWHRDGAGFAQRMVFTVAADGNRLDEGRCRTTAAVEDDLQPTYVGLEHRRRRLDAGGPRSAPPIDRDGRRGTASVTPVTGWPSVGADMPFGRGASLDRAVIRARRSASLVGRLPLVGETSNLGAQTPLSAPRPRVLVVCASGLQADVGVGGPPRSAQISAAWSPS